MRFLVKLGLTAVAFTCLLPLIHGISFHGGFLAGLVFAFLFGIILWIVDVVAIALSAVLAISSFGIALLWLIPVWILGFWLLPALALMVVSDCFPQYLSISGWTPAVLGGLVLLLIGVATSKFTNSNWRTA